MGVKGLWQLLLPTGRRISVETLSGKRLAIDASIWLTQFLKANRDPETGAVRANAHLIGFLRRICKLLYHGIKPVFVFDGATPEIKLREIRARKERRDRLNFFKSEDDNEGVKRLARRILVARLKKQKELEKSRNQARGVEVEAEVESKSGIDNYNSSDGIETEGAFASGFRIYSPIKGDENGEETAAIERQEKEAISDSEEVTIIDEVKRDVFISDKEDYLQTLTYEEQQMNNDWDDALVAAGSVSGESVASADDSDNESTLDLHKLTSLPAKSRVDVIEKARRNQRMQSRKEFMSVAADPHSYSQCQLKNFLKSANLNRQVHKLGEVDAICSRDGLEGERIASDSTRRLIFTKDETKSDNIKRQASEKHSTTSPLLNMGCNLAFIKSKDHIHHEVDSKVEMGGGFSSVGGGFIGDGAQTSTTIQMPPDPLDQVMMTREASSLMTTRK
jgi:5''-3'' exonuclease (including N-terminal domain of PolI)